MVLLLFGFSLWSWSTLFVKTVALLRLNWLSNTFEQAFWQEGSSLKHLYDTFAREPVEPMAVCFKAILQELPQTFPKARLKTQAKDDLKKRLEDALAILITKEVSSLQKGLSDLASLASTSVFIGLFGTVWGIMQSFQAIATSGNTSLAVVAPAISEALFATALGLFVAIPASFGYNALLAAVSRYHTRLEVFAKQTIFSFLSEITTEER